MTQPLPTILVVEDEDPLREVFQQALASVGYTVFTAADATQALRFSQQHDGPIDLLLADIVLPGQVNGFELAEKLIKQRPQLKIVNMSGFFAEPMDLQPGRCFLEKPFAVATLLDTVADLLS